MPRIDAMLECLVVVAAAVASPSCFASKILLLDRQKKRQPHSVPEEKP
jgi:hypothetical protein